MDVILLADDVYEVSPLEGQLIRFFGITVPEALVVAGIIHGPHWL
uniref:Uncharacterized protein n=1 Tax=Anguilla anguilla TaxID=7936 RepID=A0A0E9WRT5_ANGAN